MHACMHTYMHACIHTYTHIQTYRHTCIHAYMHTCIHGYMHTCIHAYMHTCMHASIHACMHPCMHALYIPVGAARGGVEVPLVLYYKTFLIYRTCMRRAPARPVRACFVRSRCGVVVREHDLRATPAQCNEKRTLSSHFTLHSSHPALHTSHLHFAPRTSSHLK